MSKTEVILQNRPNIDVAAVTDRLSKILRNARRISNETKQLVEKLLLEQIALAGIVRVLNVSGQRLQDYVNALYCNTPREVTLMEKFDKPTVTLECDEIWSFCETKENKQWIWLALDRDTREVVSVYIGDRNGESA